MRNHLHIAGHPLHPALVHFPLALWFTAFFWDIVGWWRPDPLWWQMAYWSLALGLAASIPAFVAGFIDYLALPPEQAGMGTATAHMMAMSGAAAAFGGSWVLRTQDGAALAPSVWALSLGAAGAALLGVGGWLGGTLVYRYGIARASSDNGGPLAG